MIVSLFVSHNNLAFKMFCTLYPHTALHKMENRKKNGSEGPYAEQGMSRSRHVSNQRKKLDFSRVFVFLSSRIFFALMAVYSY